ncbi:NAD(P)-dependent oxidoreductase [Halomonas urumqiensis]|uniref:NAD(P)-dependent oxidoreductase n=1 Tax=Halomonas urumqiensis TaxID=1684789 RepID=A0A2N7ULF6_9GAMM|nr:NAD(P)-dependent oxidoreductase [Halomonas urumqiensis]PMR81258.1 NAD(P)-dependent oxidoreductase [Halomonas urumqiensis]PTB01731.1 NAD(P)-dependent oxidoreductase [Halomonas urumqiensis]GHE22176.1 dehydrogenase [Halomonas urumqiensis]
MTTHTTTAHSTEPARSAHRVAWVGLGKLGLPMAARIIQSGRDVQGFDLSAERSALATQLGVTVHDSLAAAVAECDLVFVSIPDDRALIGLCLEQGDLVRHMMPGSVLIETSTVSVEASARVAEAASARGIHYLRSPVSGNPVAAEAGTLSAMVSGPREELEAAKPVFDAFTKAQYWLGDEEQARVAKLAINLMIAVSAGMMSEALTLARKGNIGWEAMLELIADSAVGSPMVKYKVPPLAQRDFSSTFSAAQMAKDLDLILDCAHNEGVCTPLAAQMREAYTSLIAVGHGNDDYIATVHHTERLSGLGEPALAQREGH